MFQRITGVLGKSPPSNPRNKKESAPWDEHGGSNDGSLGLQWKNNMGKELKRIFPFMVGKGISLKEGERHTQMSLE